MNTVNDLLQQCQHWAENQVSTGRLTAEQSAAFFQIDSKPNNLFNAEQQPLIVAFLGGTGVGKSTLLNRLAGQAIAKAGLERPTSREVTLYHHQSLPLQQLPADLPLASVNCCAHQAEQHKNIIWLDMPDFDSIAVANHDLVRHWLPYIDVLLYVVSPERYRDNKTWQLLLAEGRKHAWVFVMNQWDLAQPEQYTDFKRQLQIAGFVDPLIFKSDCYTQSDDQFADLLAHLQTLSQQQYSAQLADYQQQQQLHLLYQSLKRIQSTLNNRSFADLNQFQQDLWLKSLPTFQQGLAWPIQQQAKTCLEAANSPVLLWDDWAQNRFQDVLATLLQQANQLNLPTAALKANLDALAQQSATLVQQQTEFSVRNALLYPGNRLQRFFLRLTGYGEIVLPLLAMSAVGYQVFIGYYQSLNQQQAYLGADFAIHSSLLIVLSWLLPFFLHKKLQPSLEKTVLRGLTQGLQHALARLELEIGQAIEQEQQAEIILQQGLNTLLTSSKTLQQKNSQPDASIARLLLN